MLYRKQTDNKIPFTKLIEKFTTATTGSANEFTDILYQRFVVEDFRFSDDWKYWTIYEYFDNILIPHKINVYNAGLHLSKESWFKEYCNYKVDLDEYLDNLWLHDLSKFSANESFGYAFNDFTKDAPSLEFKYAWQHHKVMNPHHPEYWLNPTRNGSLKPLDMPKIYVLEMVADWIGAGKTYGDEIDTWLPGNLHTFKWSVGTATEVKTLLEYMGFKVEQSNEILYNYV